MSAPSRRFLQHFLFPEQIPPVRFPDSTIAAVTLVPYVHEVEIPMAAGSCAAMVRADIYRLIQTYSDDVGTLIANVTHPEAAGFAATHSAARCTALCIRVKVKSAVTAKQGSIVVSPIRRAGIDFPALPANHAANYARHGAVKFDATPVEWFCIRCAPENLAVLQPFEDLTTVRQAASNWGAYITTSGYTAGDILSLSLFYTFEMRVKAGIKMVPMTPPDPAGDSEMIIPAATAGKFPFVRHVAL